MTIQAVIEIGTNSMKFSVAKQQHKTVKFVHEKIAFTRLGENFQKQKKIEKHVLQRNIEAIKMFAAEAKKQQAESIAIIATQALREAENAEEFTETVKNKSGLSLVILSGKEEAYYSYLAAQKNLKIKPENALFFDIGGGSTELFHQTEYFVSLPIGVVSITEKFQKEFAKNELQPIKNYIFNELQSQTLDFKAEQLIGIGGTIVTMQKVHSFLNENETDDSITKQDVQRQLQFFEEHSPTELVEKIGLPLKRADVIFAGALLVYELMKLYKIGKIKICNYGVRHGYLLQMLEEK